MAKAYLSIGSNIGDRETQLSLAVKLLKNNRMINVDRVSSIYETEPVGGVVQDDFLNIAVAITTPLAPVELLSVLHEVEQTLHRKRLIHWGPRTIDLDIIFYDQMVSENPVVTLPHPEAHNRLFVLVPIKEISRQDQVIHEQVNQMIEATSDQNWVRKYKDSGEING